VTGQRRFGCESYLAGVGQQHLAAGAAEQGRAGKFLKLADLLADGPRRHVQLVGGAREGKMARGCFKRPEGVEGGEAFFLGHGLGLSGNSGRSGRG
jgi:hypothetical protein